MRVLNNSFVGHRRIENIQGQIADNFFLTTSLYKEAEYVHLRHYEKTEDGQKSFPTKKGASFPLGRWMVFYDLIGDIDDCIRRKKEGQSVYFHHHVGGGVYITICDKYPHVDIRRFFYPSDAKIEQPTKSGVCVTFDQWDILKSQIEKLHKQKPYLLGVVPCHKQPDHMILMTLVECKECNPFSDALDRNPLNFYASTD